MSHFSSPTVVFVNGFKNFTLNCDNFGNGGLKYLTLPQLCVVSSFEIISKMVLKQKNHE